MSEQERPTLDARTKLIAAWAGATLTALAIGGLLLAPDARMVWVVLLVFGVATIPQVLLWGARVPPKQPGDNGIDERSF